MKTSLSVWLGGINYIQSKKFKDGTLIPSFFVYCKVTKNRTL
jgi:hypothetical protein